MVVLSILLLSVDDALAHLSVLKVVLVGIDHLAFRARVVTSPTASFTAAR
jgi:hypothetical protein